MLVRGLCCGGASVRPLAALTLAFAGGVGAGVSGGVPAGPLAVSLLAAAAALALASRHGPALVLAAAAAGTLHGGGRAAVGAADCRLAIPDGAGVTLEGVFAALPPPGEAAPFHGERIRFPGAPARCAGLLRVRSADAFERPPAGSVVRLQGRWWRSAPPGAQLRRAEFGGVLTVDSMRVLDAGRRPLPALRWAAQARLRGLLPQREAALAESLLLARREGLPDATRELFVAAGLVHLLAISGMHVGLITAALLWLIARLGAGARLRAPAAVAGAALYVLFLGAPPAAARAVLQLGLLVAARAAQRPADRVALLAAAALVLLLADPFLLVDPGFQLSFLGLLGILLLMGPAERFVARLRPRSVRQGVAVSLAASALTTPVAALHFGTVAPIGVLATVVALPWLAAALPLLAATLAASVLAPPIAPPLAWMAALLLRGLQGVAQLAAAVPGGHGLVTPMGIQAVLMAVAAAMLGWRWWHVAGTPSAGASAAAPSVRARAPAVAVALAVALLTGTVASAALGGGTGALEIHAIDVGQGDAIAIRTPAGRWFLVDAGPATAGYDAGRARVVPYLLARGARRLDALVLTHPDADHIGGAGAVMDAFDVGVVVDPGRAAGKPRFIELLDAAGASTVRWVGGWAGRELAADGVLLRFLHPPPPGAGGGEGNDASVVFLLRWGDFRALFTGDAGKGVEEAIVAARDGHLRATLLKVGHHGSATSTGAELLEAVRPTIALVPVGRGNRYGHPDRLVLERLRLSGARVLRTDMLGNILLRVERDGRVSVRAERPPE